MNLLPARLIPATETPQRDDDYDDLGYYPDGAKRTLTDEQIAIFRHSEIESILRKRRHKIEEIEARQNSENNTLGQGQDGSPVGDIVQSAVTVRVQAEHARQPNRNSRKRKRNHRGRQGAPNEGVTYRRLAREHDDQDVSALDLDYDEIGTTPSTNPLAPRSDEVKDREPSNPGNSTPSRVPQSRNAASGFIWPTLHGSLT